MPELERWEPADSSMFLRITIEQRAIEGGKPEEWYLVDLFMDGMIAGHGEAANTGVLAKEGQCEETAIVYALFNFSQTYQRSLKRVYVQPREDSGVAERPGKSGEGSGAGVKPVNVDWGELFKRPEW